MWEFILSMLTRSSTLPKEEKKYGGLTFSIIKKYEGLRLKAYMPTRFDVPTIGYGHTKSVRMGDVITKEKAEELFLEDIEWVVRAVDKHVKVPLTLNQKEALCSFVFNVGEGNFKSSTLLKKLNKKDYVGAADQFCRWNKQGTTVLRGLTRRRGEERELFLTKDYG